MSVLGRVSPRNSQDVRTNSSGKVNDLRPSQRVERRMGDLFSAVVLGLYLGLAPVYWLPGLTVSALAGFKVALSAFAVSVALAVALKRRSLNLPQRVFGPVGLLLFFCLAMPGLFQSSESAFWTSLKDLILGFAMLWTAWLIQKNSRGFEVAVLIAGWVIVVLAGVVFISLFVDLPLRAPEPWQGELYITGFGGLRTKWSAALALYLPVCWLAITKGTTFRSYRTRFLLITAFALTLQVASGGRAGIAAVMVEATLLFPLFWKRAKWKYVFFATAVVWIFLGTGAADRLRIDRLSGVGKPYEKIDSFSSGRISGYQIAIDQIQDRPLVGRGFGQGEQAHEAEFGYRLQVHNLWLRLMVASGILLPSFFAVFTFLLIKNWVHLDRDAMRDPTTGKPNVDFRSLAISRSCGAVLIGGFVLSLFAPNVLIGSFQNEAVWWVVAGALLAESSRQCRRRTRSFLATSGTSLMNETFVHTYMRAADRTSE